MKAIVNSRNQRMKQLQFEQLRERAMGDVIVPKDAAYDETRSLWNALIDKRPAAILRATSAEDVATAVTFARSHELKVSVRGGGHNIAGTASGDGVLMIDLSLMNTVTIDPDRRTVAVQGGATLHDLDRATSAFDLATPGGVVSSTGVAGLTLGGGFGWLSRLHGLAADNLLSVDVVTAAGEILCASAGDHDDLFWALKGGSGNFGIATTLRFRLHKLPRNILFGPTFFAIEEAADCLRNYRDVAVDAPRECCVWSDLMTAPPFPFIPERYHGTPVLGLMQCYIGDAAEGEAVLRPLREFGAPIADAVGPMRYVDAQQILDETYAKGLRNYWKSSNFKMLNDAAIDELVALAKTMPTRESDILISLLGGCIGDVAIHDTAFPHRAVSFVVTPGARWSSAGDDGDCLAWIEDAGARLREFEDGGQYVNFIAERDGEAARAYGVNLERLERVKGRYDPDNLFCQNQNIRPATTTDQ